ncbi:MAG: ThiF family adenylyltransferase [Paracoccaceae bacterium]
MNIAAWVSDFDVTTVSDLGSSAASAFVAFAERHASHLMRFIEVRRGETGELVIIDFRTGRPQQSVCPIKRTERLAVRFGNDDAMPLVYVLRDDFPDTPHQQLTFEGSPRAICIDDRIWAEARLTWTPAELVHRILSWFERAAKGHLHDARQPLDPVMIGSPLSFIISRDDLAQAADLDLVGINDPVHRQMLPVKRLDAVRERPEDIEPLCLSAYIVAPEDMRRLTFAPSNLGSLADMLAERGIDLFEDLRAKFSAWLGQTPPPAWRINGRFAVIVEMPIIAPDGALQNGTDLRAFITDRSVAEIAVALGIAAEAGTEADSKVGYVKLLGRPKPDLDAVRAIAAQSAEVHYAYDRVLASQLSGRTTLDERKVVIVGAGAIGSHIADCLSREGRFRWTVIDDDRLLPHNLARHIGRRGNISAEKAALVAAAVSCQLETAEPIAEHIFANVMTEGDARERIDAALNEADLIIDTTASVLAGRYLSDHPSTARRVSVFFNPTGTGGVLLAEPEDRQLTLRDLEAQMFSLVGRDDRLVHLLAPPEQNFAYTGACRAITNRMPESNVMALSGLLAHALGIAVDQPAAVSKTWVLEPSGAVEYFEPHCEALECFQAGDWRVCVDRGLIQRILAMRDAKLPNETGGVLTGVVDIPAKCIHLADAAPAPEDSLETPGGFTRGTSGVQAYLDGVFKRTRGQVRYVGEWHSHPPRSATNPSTTDLVQIDWLSTLFEIDTLPALMLIAGDHDVSIILANRRADLQERPEGHHLRHAGGGQ